MEKKYKAIIIIIVLIFITSVVSVVNSNHKNAKSISVDDYYSLCEFECEQESMNSFYKDSYSWYKSMEEDEDVFIINTAYYDKKVLKIWKDEKIYNTIPSNPFWYFAASPSYLDEIGIDVEQAYLNQAKSGVRLYMIPDTLSRDEIETLTSFLKEDAIKNIEQNNISTPFTENQEIRIITYTPTGSYFTWTSEKGQPLTDKAPVIYVCTSANMKYFESESLIATGVNSYIKFRNEETLKQYNTDSRMVGYNLSFAKSSEIYKNAAKDKTVSANVKNAFK